MKIVDNEIKLQVGVKIVIQNAQGQCLLLHRAPGKYTDVKTDRWDIVGGRIHPGQTLLENLKREVKEETGLEIVGTPKLVAAQDILKNAGQHVVRLTYVGKAEGEIKLDPNEHDKYQWFDFSELKDWEETDVYFRELLQKSILPLK